MRFAYPANIQPDDDGRFLVTFRDLPEAATDGADRAEALAEAVDCLTSGLAFRLKYDEVAALPSPRLPGEVMIAPDVVIGLKTLLKRRIEEHNLAISAVARALGIDAKEVRRMLDPQHATKVGRLVDALRNLGLPIDLVIETREEEELPLPLALDGNHPLEVA
jgi:antitoxin HicB